LSGNEQQMLDSMPIAVYIANHDREPLQAQQETKMNRIRLIVIGTALSFGLAAAPQSTTGSGDSGKAGLPSAQEQMKGLSHKLDLTHDQQVKIKPVIQQLHDVTLKLMEDKSLTQQERLEKVSPLRYDADRKIRTVLNEEQKKKLDEYEMGPENQLHGTITGANQ
jgi:Spy/CpxP family protein refolding chaperone